MFKKMGAKKNQCVGKLWVLAQVRSLEISYGLNNYSIPTGHTSCHCRRCTRCTRVFVFRPWEPCVLRPFLVPRAMEAIAVLGRQGSVYSFGLGLGAPCVCTIIIIVQTDSNKPPRAHCTAPGGRVGQAALPVQVVRGLPALPGKLAQWVVQKHRQSV